MLLPVLDLFFNRIDPWPAAAATLAMAAWRRGAPRTLGFALALGAGIKLWPLILAGAIFVPPPAASQKRRFVVGAASTFAATSAALAAGTLLFGGWRSLSQVLTFRGARGWQIESLVGSLIHLAGSTPRFETGSWRIGTLSGAVSIGLFAVATPVCLWIGWRAARRERVGVGWSAALAVLLLLSALFSAQYVIWLIPAAAIAWDEDEKHLALLNGLAVLLTAVFWAWFPAVLGSRWPALALVVLRNGVVVAIAAFALARLNRPGNSAADARIG
jgi:hypothetical protein